MKPVLFSILITSSIMVILNSAISQIQPSQWLQTITFLTHFSYKMRSYQLVFIWKHLIIRTFMLPCIIFFMFYFSSKYVRNSSWADGGRSYSVSIKCSSPFISRYPNAKHSETHIYASIQDLYMYRIFLVYSAKQKPFKAVPKGTTAFCRWRRTINVFSISL